MKLRKLPIVFAVMLSSGLTVIPSVKAVPLSTFNTGTFEQQAAYVTRTLQLLSEHFASKPETAHLAPCMEKLFLTGQSDGTNVLMKLINTELSVATLKGDKDYEINDIIAGVIVRECSQKPADAEGATKTTQ